MPHAATGKVAEDLNRGQQSEQFIIDDLNVAIDFFKSVTLSGAYAMSLGASHPSVYMDAAVGMGLSALGCQSPLRERAIAFSRKHLDDWVAAGRVRWTPLQTPV